MSVNGEPIGGREALRLGLADEFAPSATALLAAYRVAEACISGKKKLPGKNWDAIAVRQAGKMKAVMKMPRVQGFLSSPAPGQDAAQDLAAAREFAAKYVFKALEYGYKAGFKKGLTHDAKLFGEVAASPSGQEWIRRFIDKDPRQSSFLTILTPG